MIQRRRFLASSTAAVAGGVMLAPSRSSGLGPLELRPSSPIGLAAPSQQLPHRAALRPARPEGVRILQLTDIHFFCDRDTLGAHADERTVDDFRKLIDLHAPDLLAITGDLWQDNPDHRGAEFFAWSLERISGLGIPWLFTWGNHDELDDYAAAQVALTEAKGSLYRGGHSGGNYEIALTDGDGESARVLWRLVCLNTTNQGVQRAQEEWLAARAAGSGGTETETTGGFCFLHIPLMEYHALWNAGQCKGIHLEDVCTYGEDGSAFAHLQKLGGIKACFCGHDHVNDYSGSRDGIEMVYGRASGHAGYGGDKLRKGAKLITLDTTTGAYQWKTVFADGTDWHPKA